MGSSFMTSRRHVIRAATGIGAVTGLALTGLVYLPAASAAVPVFPNNVVVFPDRDFVSVEGYAEHAGETATIEVSRPGTGVMGSAKAVVSGTDVAFEVNHPGGICWGAGTTLNVTPDIKAGDVVKITFPDGSHDETTTSSATVTKDMVQDGTTITVEGSIGADVNPDFIEQRIINPDLVALVGKRDVRALPGPIVPAARGGYSSGLTFPTPTTFLATYQFDTLEAADAAAAADLGERAMNWQVQDADGNRQGLTIAEFGEAGGPGMGGCPQGPGSQSAPGGSASVVRTGTSAQVKWTPVTAQPGADPVTGYSVQAVGAPDANGVRTEQGLRLGSGATQANLTGLDSAATYTFEVRSMAGDKMSAPFTIGGTGGAGGDTTAPTLTLSPAAGAGVTEASSVTVNSNGQVFFTTDGSPVISGDLPSDTAKLYTGPIPITELTTVKVAAFDPVGNFTVDGGDFAPAAVALPDTPTGLAATKTQNSVALTWNAGPASVTGYQVTVYDAAGAKLGTQPPVTSVPRQTITGLQPATTYGFTVAAKNAGGTSAESAKITATTNQATDSITITTAKWKSGDFKIVGTGNQLGAIVQAYRVNTDGSLGAPIAGATAQVVAAAPPGIGDWTIRLRNAAAGTSNPGRIIVKSDKGGQAGPFTVSNG
jgi:hypothetical protein